MINEIERFWKIIAEYALHVLYVKQKRNKARKQKPLYADGTCATGTVDIQSFNQKDGWLINDKSSWRSMRWQTGTSEEREKSRGYWAVASLRNGGPRDLASSGRHREIGMKSESSRESERS